MKTCSTAFLVIAIMITLLTNKCSTKKQSTMAGNLDDASICTSTTKSVPRDFSWVQNDKLIYYIAWKLSPDRVWLFLKNPSCHNSCFKFYYVICTICRRSVLVVFPSVVLLLRCSAALLMFHYSLVLRLFCQYLVVCSVIVPVFRRCSVFRSSVFLCSWF